MFDSWYASNKLFKFCRRQGWHVVCAIKSNRTLDGVKLSKWNQRLKRPKYFLCTDLSLSPQKILTFYKKRWPIEVDNYYVKQLLGLGDFRVQSYEAIEKWFAIIFLAYTFLQWRLNHAQTDERFKVVADVIRQHRQQHARRVLEAVCEFAVICEDMSQVFQRFVSNGSPVPT